MAFHEYLNDWDFGSLTIPVSSNTPGVDNDLLSSETLSQSDYQQNLPIGQVPTGSATGTISQTIPIIIPDWANYYKGEFNVVEDYNSTIVRAMEPNTNNDANENTILNAAITPITKWVIDIGLSHGHHGTTGGINDVDMLYKLPKNSDNFNNRRVRITKLIDRDVFHDWNDEPNYVRRYSHHLRFVYKINGHGWIERVGIEPWD